MATARAGRRVPRAQRARRPPGRAHDPVRRRLDGDRGLPDLPRSGAPGDPLADRRDRCRPLLRPCAPRRPLPGTPRSPRSGVSRSRPCSRSRVRTHRASGAGAAGGLPPRRPALPPGRRRRRAPEPPSAGDRTAAGRARRRRHLGRSGSGLPARSRAGAGGRTRGRRPGCSRTRGLLRTAHRPTAGRRPRRAHGRGRRAP